MGSHQTERFQKKSAKFVFGQLAGGHRKFAVLPRAFAAAHMAFHSDIVGRICKNGGGFFSPEERAMA